MFHATVRATGDFRIELTCRRCGQPYTPSSGDIRAGPEVYHRCPPCRVEATREALRARLARVRAEQQAESQR